MKVKYIIVGILIAMSTSLFAQTLPIGSVVEGVFSAIGIPTRQSQIDKQKQDRQKQIDNYHLEQRAERDKKAQDATDRQARLDSYKTQGWIYATDNTQKDLFYISGEDIRANGDNITVWIKTKFSKPITSNKKTARSSISLTEYDCKNRTYQVQEQNFYSGNNGDKSIVISDDDIPDFDYNTNRIIPDTAILCSKRTKSLKSNGCIFI